MVNDLICFSHLRWDFVYQRPQHLLTRFSDSSRVFYFEEPIFGSENPYLDVNKPDLNIWVITPHLNWGVPEENFYLQQKLLLDDLITDHGINDYILWYYSPMAMSFTSHLQPCLTIYDCMDELSAFRFAPPSLTKNEELLFSKADIVFTGGHNLYNSKKHKHPNVHAMPSSIDKEHFAAARDLCVAPDDQKPIAHPRLGFYGVIDERMDLELVGSVAGLYPDWNFVFLGPVVKIDPRLLPKNKNIHYLGSKTYDELPSYLSGWDIAIMPFAINGSTEFISPTKTPEYLAGGKPVISTPIKDVIEPYGNLGLVEIVKNAEGFCRAAANILKKDDSEPWLKEVDRYLSNISWDKTWGSMNDLMEGCLIAKNEKKTIQYV